VLAGAARRQFLREAAEPRRGGVEVAQEAFELGADHGRHATVVYAQIAAFARRVEGRERGRAVLADAPRSLVLGLPARLQIGFRNIEVAGAELPLHIGDYGVIGVLAPQRLELVAGRDRPDRRGLVAGEFAPVHDEAAAGADRITVGRDHLAE